ncbi:methyl-accepting chemotaxis protein [Nostocaceae cyanobacterium CENA357]|uniref:Methyl-accepting chemotaxis protein n=1 Tax=Atlanticothrix silvestris CENA357 TaxID=1725252 RepID=A0A8J7L1P3_9CYAN|nr:methyl-accepting chemotaxis protein [Atlanticothrix silvestris]MBH8551162.1 methyl-accepting chemotaxis protein [Atlanticothrix silvestris CENA357]
MFNKTDMTKSSDAQNRAAFVSSQKVTDNIAQLPNKPHTVPINDFPWNHFKRLGLGKKAIILAIAIGTIPVLGIGAIAYSLANKAITKQITQAQAAAAVELTEEINRLLLGRYGDIQSLSNMPFLANYKVSARTTNQEKQAVFNQMIEAQKAYDSIAVFDLEGNLIVQSTGEPLDNQKDRNYFQQTLQKDAPIISKPEKSKNADVASIYITAPIKDPDTKKTLAVVRARMPVTSLAEVIKNHTANGQQYYLLDTSGKIFLSSQKALLGKEAKAEYPGLAQLLTAKKINPFTAVQKTNQKPELVSYIPSTKLTGLPDLNWQLLLSTDTATVFAPRRQLLWTIAIATIVTALITAAIAAWLAKRNTQPILNATEALTELGKGELNTRLDTQREDELGVMSTNINQIAAQLQVLVTEKAEIAQTQNTTQQGSQAETLQQQLLELLNNVEGAARGDLTVRADVTTGEIGTVADFFNSIVENLRDIVTQVKQAATQVDGAIGSNEGAIRQLAEEALIQADEINRTLDAVDQMTHSMQTVADNAQQAAVVANHAAHSANKSGQAMDLTVQNILSLRETVGETTKKVKRLGESSQQISRVVSLINQIATQTNLLAINAGIEAARAGEEGQGFAVVAEEVGELAIRSAAATQEIEQIVDNIQRETSEVVQAMEIGTTQVVEGTRIVEEAKQSLSQILDVSRQIDSLVQSISTATASQVETSQTVSQLMQDIAAGSQRTSASSRLVSNSLQKTVEISHQLQETVETFKVS